MAQLTHEQYEILERAVVKGTRVSLRRNGQGRREFVVIPTALRMRNGREVIEVRNPTTGFQVEIFVDEISALEPVK
ncbi:MAG TPA: hypothetical protein VGM50_04360 [Gemmatimonadaceae bacterium]|jgi:hypothetical protein